MIALASLPMLSSPSCSIGSPQPLLSRRWAAWAPSRNDQQIKLRGHRSEFSEIEFALAGCDCVEDAAVVVRCGESGLPRAPAAYVESSPGGEELRPREQRQLLFFLLLLGRTSG